MKKFLLILLLAGRLSAVDYYFSQTSTGAANGSSASDTVSVATFNGHALSPDDRAILVGTVTSAVTPQSSGTSGHPITLLFYPGAKMSSTAFASTGAIVIASKNYITIDGGAIGTIGGYLPTGTPNGIMENTDNGTALGTQQGSAFIKLTGTCLGITIQGLTMNNLYQRTGGSTDTSQGNYAIWATGGAFQNFTVTNCVIHDAENGVRFEPNSTTGATCTISYVTAYNVNWGCGGGPSTSGNIFTGVYVHHNYFYGFSIWDGTGAALNTFHHNGAFFFAANGSTVNTVRYYDNFIGPDFNTGVGGVNHCTSGLFIQFQVTDVWMYNNIFLSTGDTPSNAFMYVNMGSYTTGTYSVFSNTINSTGGNGTGISFTPNSTIGGGVQTLYSRNNIFIGLQTAIAVYVNATAVIDSDANDFYNLTAAKAFVNSTTTSSSFYTLANWKAIGGTYDPNAITGNPALDGAYRPTVGSPVIGTGADTTSYSATDFYGATWTLPMGIGAVQNSNPFYLRSARFPQKSILVH